MANKQRSDFPLVAAEKPGAANGLVIPDHGFVLEQEVVNVAIQQFFLGSGRFLPKIPVVSWNPLF